ASGRPLPQLEKILASHPLIHTAEGVFFREAVRRACEKLKIPVTGIRERELEEEADKKFGSAARKMHKRIDDMGKIVGAPWTKDQKSAALAAVLALENLSAKQQVHRLSTSSSA